MPELSIHFTSPKKDEKDVKEEASPIHVRLFRPETGNWTEPTPFEPPLDDEVLADLRWYLETFSEWPTGPDYERAERIEAQMEEWGRALLESVTPDRESAQVWRQFADAPFAENGGKLVTIDAIDPRVLRLPWELLADEGGHLFSAGIGVRRRLKKITSRPPEHFELPARVLVVVARPTGAGFIDPRAVSRPLLDALDALGSRVVTEFLYPPTLKALTDRLRDRHAPPVHVVHFDGHGVYDAQLGLGYLLFENDQHEPDRVDANRLGNLLNRCGVPLMALNACQSAAQEEGNPYASVAARLIRAGVGSVLAMNYSVLVVAARLFVGEFYAALADGLSVGRAVDEGRYALMADKERHTLTRRDDAGRLIEETIKLSDWFLPALYQQAQDPVVFKADARGAASPSPLGERGPGGETSGSPSSLAERGLGGEVPPPPRYDFHGRAREMLRLERALAERRVIVLHGFGGIGKTTLAAEAGRWFHRTGRFPGGAAFVSFEHGGSLDQLCSWVAQAISGDPDYLLHQDDADPVAAVGDLLRARPALIILDNFESVIGPDPLMPPDELDAILDAVWGWVSIGGARHSHGNASNARNRQLDGGSAVGAMHSHGNASNARNRQPDGSSPNAHHRQTNASPLPSSQRSRLLITTRDTTFNDARFAPSRDCAHIELGGLATRDALDLAAAVLDAHSIDRAGVPRQDLVDLMAHLGGHPLSLNLALPHLRDHTPAELTADFEALLPGFTEGEAQARNESLAVSLEFSLRRLGADTRAALPDLAVFQGGCLESELLAITGMDEDLWPAARAELEAAALLTAESIPGVTPPFLRFHPTLAPYLATRLDDDRRAELSSKYWQRYYALAKYLYHADTQTPHQARAVAAREMPNLRRALDLALDAAASQTFPPDVGGDRGGVVVDFAARIAQFLDNFGRWREREAMMADVERCMLNVTSSRAGEEDRGLTKAAYLLMSRQGETLWQQGHAAEAERVFRALLAKIEAGAAYDAAYDNAMALWRLGRCLKAQGRPAQAISFHERALEGFERISESSESAKEMVGKVYTDLGDNLAAVGKFDEAQAAYENGLEISREMEDHRSVGVKLGQLGNLALARGELGAARERHTEALATFQKLGEPQMAAVAWHNLGRVAEEVQDWEEAEHCHREGIRLDEQTNDLPTIAKACNQLALVAKGAGRLDDAERWYLRAQELKDEIAPYDASTLSNLANLYLAQDRLDEAESYARRAVEIKQQLDLSSEPWTTYQILAQIAEARGQVAAAARWRRKEQESYAAYAGAAHKLPQWAPQFIAAVAGAVQGHQEAIAAVNDFLPQLEATSDWKNLPPVVRRILEGETDFEALRVGLDRIDAYIIRAILAQLSGEGPAAPAQESRESGGGEAGAEAAVAQIRQQWAPVVQVVVAAAAAGAGAAASVPPELAALLDQLGATDDWGALVGALRRVLAGERDPAALLPGLDQVDAVILGDVLRGLGAAPRAASQPSSPPPRGEAGEGSEGISLEQLLELVAVACTPQAPAGLGEQLFGMTQQLARDPSMPAEIQALGRVLNHILSGERNPDLSALSPELAAAVRQLLAAVA